jgi:predicted phosphodiesterase
MVLKKEVIVVLGSPNSDKGELESIAISRLNHCLDIYTNGMLVLCTGGWGQHFNTTQTAHAVYAKNYLIKRGIPADAFLGNALSDNSVDDAVKVKRNIEGMTDLRLTIITSDFHAERIKLIFNEILRDYACSIVGVQSNMDSDELNRLVKHEQQAIASILKNGLYYEA